MATWADLSAFIHSQYKVSSEKPGILGLAFETGGRSQMVIITHHALMGGTEEWAQVESAFAQVGEVDLLRVIQEVGTKVVGALGMVDDLLTVRHALPLANLDINEIVRPLELVTSTADRLEAMFVGGDRF
jgi:hypothetical protein